MRYANKFILREELLWLGEEEIERGDSFVGLNIVQRGDGNN